MTSLTLHYITSNYHPPPLILQLSGLLLMIVGGIAQGFFSTYMKFFSGNYETPAIGVVILGAIILVISFFGCCGAKRENVFMLRVVSCGGGGGAWLMGGGRWSVRRNVGMKIKRRR